MHRVLTRSIIVMVFTLAAVQSVAALHVSSALTGKWRGETTNGVALALDLVATATEVTGTLTRRGRTVTITDGKVSRNTFTFKAIINEQTEAFSGQYAGDEMKVWPDRQGPQRAATLKRVKT